MGGCDPKTQATKAKIEKWDLIKLKTCSTEKETTNKVKRQPIEGEKRFVNHMSERRLIFKIYKELNQQQEINVLILKWAKNLNRHFSKEGIQIPSRYMKRCSTSLIIREMKTKTIVRYHLTTIRMAIIRKIKHMFVRMLRKGDAYTLLVRI